MAPCFNTDLKGKDMERGTNLRLLDSDHRNFRQVLWSQIQKIQRIGGSTMRLACLLAESNFIPIKQRCEKGVDVRLTGPHK